MLLKLLGWLWLACGVFILFKPDALHKKIVKKKVDELKFILFWVTLVLGLLLMRAAWGIPGALASIIFVCGIIGLIKAVFFLKAKQSDQLIVWMQAQTVQTYQLSAIIMVAFGALLLTV